MTSEEWQALADKCRQLANQGCYCCEVWPVNEEAYKCERCMILRDVAIVLEQVSFGQVDDFDRHGQ